MYVTITTYFVLSLCYYCVIIITQGSILGYNTCWNRAERDGMGGNEVGWESWDGGKVDGSDGMQQGGVVQPYLYRIR